MNRASLECTVTPGLGTETKDVVQERNKTERIHSSPLFGKNSAQKCNMKSDSYFSLAEREP